MRVMVTGAAGFIGTHLVAELRQRGFETTSLDSFATYYSPDLKRARQVLLADWELRGMIAQVDLTMPIPMDIAGDAPIDAIVHLAAQPGVRLPPTQYDRYVQANLVALGNVFDFAVATGIKNVLYASSSSVYGDGTPTPFTESAIDLAPTSFYGSTKLAGEEVARAYSRAAGIAARGMRYFTVYGPWGRPDMAYFRLVAAALGEWEFTLTGVPGIRRDFTFVEDTVRSTVDLLEDLVARPLGHHDVVNVGGGQSRTMGDLIKAMEDLSGVRIRVSSGEPVSADMAATEADFGLLEALTGQHPRISLEEGLERCLNWASRPEVRRRLRAWIESTT